MFLDLQEVKQWKALEFPRDKQYLEWDWDLFQVYTGYYFKDLLAFTRDHLQMDEEYSHIIMGRGMRTAIKLYSTV